VLNTHKSAILQTLSLLGNKWCSDPFLVKKFMKGVFNVNPPKPRYRFTWDVSIVLKFLQTLFPLEKLCLKMLTLKLCALIALSSAPRAQTIVSMSLDHVQYGKEVVTFFFPNLLKTTRSGRSNTFVMNLEHYKDESLCVMHTLLFYIKVTRSLRKSRKLIVSYKTYDSVSTSTIARWLKNVLSLSGIDVGIYKAHSYRSASVSAAYGKCSLQTILHTADWSTDKNFYKFYFRSSKGNNNTSFSEAVFSK
jgi:hypothetical protein